MRSIRGLSIAAVSVVVKVKTLEYRKRISLCYKKLELDLAHLLSVDADSRCKPFDSSQTDLVILMNSVIDQDGERIESITK